MGIIGGGILGLSIAYHLSGYASSDVKVTLMEQEGDVARHASGRNTGKVHAPFIYNPKKKKKFAKAAYLGFELLKRYCNAKGLSFRNDGVLEVAIDDKSIDHLNCYLSWGLENGLSTEELMILEKDEVKEMEPNVSCLSAILCKRDASVDYAAITKELARDAIKFGCKILTGHKVTNIREDRSEFRVQIEPYSHMITKEQSSPHSLRNFENESQSQILTTPYTQVEDELKFDFIINAAGGKSLDIAHQMNFGTEYCDIHFRGEYWRAPNIYDNLTKMSIYSVPRYTDIPFLDPHWIVRSDGRREVGPNAVPVFGPYAYNWRTNLKELFPKILEVNTPMLKAIMNISFLSFAFEEMKSSLSKTAMINRTRRFLPSLRPELFTSRGTAGIRSPLVDKDGKFVPDTLIEHERNSVHILNYNSPGATGALPIGAMIVCDLVSKGFLPKHETKKGIIWDVEEAGKYMDDN